MVGSMPDIPVLAFSNRCISCTVLSSQCLAFSRDVLCSCYFRQCACVNRVRQSLCIGQYCVPGLEVRRTRFWTACRVCLRSRALCPHTNPSNMAGKGLDFVWCGGNLRTLLWIVFWQGQKCLWCPSGCVLEMVAQKWGAGVRNALVVQRNRYWGLKCLSIMYCALKHKLEAWFEGKYPNGDF